MPRPDIVTIRVPADTGHLELVRAAASAVAVRMDFTFDRITDLHIALDELCSRILATSDPPATRLEVAFEVTSDQLRVTAVGDRPLKDGEEFLNPWSKVILEAVTDDVRIADRDGIAVVSVIVEKEPA